MPKRWPVSLVVASAWACGAGCGGDSCLGGECPGPRDGGQDVLDATPSDVLVCGTGSTGVSACDNLPAGQLLQRDRDVSDQARVRRVAGLRQRL
jgi:hypothetical protein